MKKTAFHHLMMARRNFLKTFGATALLASSPALDISASGLIEPNSLRNDASLETNEFNPPLAAGATYYLSPHGNDGQNGSEKAPWQDLSVAITRLGPGDILVCTGNFKLSGSPFRYAVTAKAGMPDKPITIMARNPGEAVFDGSATIGHFLTLDHPYWIIEGLEIVQFNLNGVQVRANNCVVRQCVIHDYALDTSLFPDSSTTVGIHLKNQASKCTIEDCLIYNSPQGEAIYVGEGVSGEGSIDNTIRRNRISNVWEGVDVKPASSPNTIELNTIDNCGHFGINSPDGVTIQRNTVIRSGRQGTKAGISVKGDSVVRYNAVIRCPNFGIRVQKSNNIIEDNLIAGSGKSPIEDVDGNNTIQRNTILTADDND